VKVPRLWLEDRAFSEPVLSYLLRLVDSNRSKTVYGTHLKPGQVLVGTKSMAKCLSVSRSTVYRRMLYYERRGWIIRRVVSKRTGTVISIPALMKGSKQDSYPETNAETYHGTLETEPPMSISSQKQQNHGTYRETIVETNPGNNQERKKEYILPLGEKFFLTDKNKKYVSRHSELRTFWCSEYLGKHGAAYNWTGRDGKDLKDLLFYAEANYDGTGVEKIKQGIESYLTDDDSWITERAHPLWVFAKEPQRWLSKKASNTEEWPEI